MDSRTLKLRKAFHYCNLYDLNREERLNFTQMILRQDVPSWKCLTEQQVERLLDGLEGYGLIQHIMSERQPA